MKTNEELLADKLANYEEQLTETTAFIRELKHVTAKYGTESGQFETDLMEAENNAKFYESEITRINETMSSRPKSLQTHASEAPPAQSYADAFLPRTMKQSVAPILVASISFAAGLLLGSTLNSRDRNRD